MPDTGGRLTDARLAFASPDIKETEENDLAGKIVQTDGGVRRRINLPGVIGPPQPVLQAEVRGDNRSGAVRQLGASFPTGRQPQNGQEHPRTKSSGAPRCVLCGYKSYFNEKGRAQRSHKGHTFYI
jgi:hypothetical protein